MLVNYDSECSKFSNLIAVVRLHSPLKTPPIISKSLDFISSIVLIKLAPSDFQIRQEWFFHEYNALFFSVKDLVYTSFPFI